MPLDAEVLAAPSTAEAEPESQGIDHLSDVERSEWLQTGKLPEQPKKEESAPSKAAPEGGDKLPKTAPATEPDKQEQQRKPSGVERRIAELTRARREAERAVDAERLRVQELERKIAEAARPAQQAGAAEDGRPQQSGFDTWEAYQEALTEWKWNQLESKKAQAQTEALQRQRQVAVQQQQRQVQEQFDNSFNEAVQTIPDFEEVLSADVPMSDPVLAVCYAHPKGATLAYHLAKNPERLAEINRLNPQAAYAELDKFAAELGKTNGSAPATPKITKAGPPGTELGGGKAAPADEVWAAVADGDFARFKAAADARELKTRRW